VVSALTFGGDDMTTRRGLLAGVVLGMVVGVGFMPPTASDALSSQDREEIVQVALDYIDGFYDGNAERMARAVHPELAKRRVVVDPQSGEQSLSNMTAKQLVDVTAAGNGKEIAAKLGRRSDVMILDVFGDLASVRVDAITWIDYLHVAKVNGEWKLINVLWGERPAR
jgi:hypothetical protein